MTITPLTNKASPLTLEFAANNRSCVWRTNLFMFTMTGKE